VRALVLGGYGNFGARICRALAPDPRIELIVAGRDRRRAATLAASLHAAAVELDTSAADFADRLAWTRPDLVIHTAGPFQGQDYRVPEAVAAVGAHYIDLADGRRFVCDFPAALDGHFRRAGRSAVSGASTVPALSSAVVAAALQRVARLEAIDMCIAPGQRAPRGVATLAGVLSYCGAPVQVWRQGRWQELPGWSAPQPVRFARLRPRLGAVCDIPDLELFPRLFAPVREVMFRAALEVGFTQRAFAAVGWARARGLLKRPERLAGLLHRAGRLADALGSGDGGMYVRLAGEDPHGRPLRLAWHITAPGGHGPEIPCMAAILLARRLAAGQPLPPGAMTAAGLLELAEFEPEFRRWGMTTEWEQAADGA